MTLVTEPKLVDMPSLPPTSLHDLFSDDALADPYPGYAELRQHGPAVHLPQLDCWALPRYAEVRTALGDHETFSSAMGVGFFPLMNEMTAGSVISSDPPRHTALRDVLLRFLGPRTLRSQTAAITTRVEDVVDGVLSRGDFDAVGDLAEAVPLAVVVDLVGLPSQGREHLLEYAAGAFDVFGPAGERTESSLKLTEQMVGYIMTVARRDQLAPGSIGSGIYDAADAGDIDEGTAQLLLLALVQAGMDTTINGLSASIALFADHPDQWQLLKGRPEMVPDAFAEVLRFESPVQVFSRVLTRDWTADDTTIPQGSRVALLYGSANRDERKWDRPDEFDITRQPADHLAFGHGIHACVGQFLARIETHAVLAALARRVAVFETGPAERKTNSLLRGYRSLPCHVELED